MLYNGEQIGDGSPPQVDIAVDPLEGTTLAAQRHAQRARRDRAVGARRRCSIPGPCVYMEKMAGAPEIADLLDLDRPLGETVRARGRAQGLPVSDVMVVVLDRPRHERGDRRDPRGRRARAPDRPWRRLGRAARRHRALAGRPAVGHRRHARGRDLGGGRQVPRRPAAGAPVAARRRRAAAPRSTPATTSSGCSTATTWSPATTCSSRPPASPTATCCRACATPAPAGPRTESLVTRTRSGTIRRIRATHDRAKLRACR